MDDVVRQDHASKKKGRRGSRGDMARPLHYGPVASTSSVAALVQAYLQPELTNSAKSCENEKSLQEEAIVLYLSESRFDRSKLRFGGKSKAVALAAGADSGSSRTASRGSRLTFGPNTRVVATREIIHDTLHCRCMCILLCDVVLDTKKTNKDAKNVKRSTKDAIVDTAHLVMLSPNDLYSAISVDSFPILISSKAGMGAARRSSSCGRDLQMSSEGHVSRAFEVMDGPVVLHRPASSPSEAWPGLEIYRPSRDWAEGTTTPSWRGERVLLTKIGQNLGQEEVVGGVDGDYHLHSHGDTAEDNDVRFDEGTGSPENTSPGAEAANSSDVSMRSITVPDFLLCSQDHSFEATATILSRSGGHTCSGSTAGDSTAAAVVALPASAAPRGMTIPPPPVLASLSFGDDGQPSLSPWLSLPSKMQRSFTCLCRGPPNDSGTVGLADVSSGFEAGGGLVLRPLPPTIYVGASDRVVGGDSDEDIARGRGALWELQRGRALSCARSLPAPPRSLMPAAVDDGQGVLLVLLADASRTALLLARDSFEFPAVEEYQGVSCAFIGDFLSNGREQVALLPVVMPETASTADGAKEAQRAASSISGKAGAGKWDQLPLKSLVKRALVTDCSCVWGNGRRDDLASLPGAGPIHVVRTSPNVLGGKTNVLGGRSAATLGDDRVASGSEALSGRKRQRVESSGDASVERSGEASVMTAGAASSTAVASNKVDDHRLSRLSSVVSVLRRRVQTEEARLLRLRQSRRGKMAVVEASKMMLAAQVAGESRPEGTCTQVKSREQHKSALDVFSDGLVPCFWEEAPSAVPPSAEHFERWSMGRALECSIARARFHSPSRVLCVDATVCNPKRKADGDASRGLSEVATNICLSIGCASGKVQTRSGACPRLVPGQSATVRACVEVSPTLLTDKTASCCGVASMLISCSWSWTSNGSLAERVPHAASRLHSAIFARVLVSPRDFLRVVGLDAARSDSALLSQQVNSTGVRDDSVKSGTDPDNATSHIGLFDVGTRLDLLVYSEQPSLSTLPQAVRALSCLASLPEPWAGGGSARVTACSERAAECTLRASDSSGAAAVLLRVAAGALPDGVRACADDASSASRALIVAFADALLAEISAIDRVARERRGARQSAQGAVTGGVALLKALEHYVDAQMETDILAARLAARLLPAGVNHR